MFNADLALSVTMTAISTVLSTMMLPLNLLLYTHFTYQQGMLATLDWHSLFFALVVVVTAIGVGLYCSFKFHSRKFNAIANHCGNLAGLTLIVFSATMTSAGSAETKIWSRPWTFYVAVSTPCILGLLISFCIAIINGLKRPECVTVAIECCYQNVGIATSMALSMFNGAELSGALGVPFFYGAVEAMFVGLFCIMCWKLGWTKAPPDANFFVVLFTSYEVLDYVRKDLDGIEVSYSNSDEALVESVNTEGNILSTYFNMAWLDALEELDRKINTEGKEQNLDYSDFA